MINNMLTVLIPTHALKVEVIGPLKDYTQHNLTAPSTLLLETVVSNIEKNMDGQELKFIVGLDHKIDDPLSVQYYNNLVSFSNRKTNVEITSVNSILSSKPMTTFTATNNFFNLISRCETEWFMLWEHDWIFTDKIDIEQIKIWETKDVDMLRFNQHKNAPREFPEDVWEKDNRLMTSLYSNNPFITTKTIWKEKYYPIAKNIPTWWGEYGAFIEGPIKKYFVDRLLKDKERFLVEYKIGLYGKLNDEPIIKHLNGQQWRGL